MLVKTFGRTFHIRCDFERGHIFRLFKNGYKQIGLSIDDTGFYQITLNNKKVRVHRYLYEQYHNVTLHRRQRVTHINGIKTDNRIVNLRAKKQLSDCITSRYKGVSWHRNKWTARIHYKGKLEYLGLFINEENARDAYITRAKYLNDNYGCNYNY